MRAKGWGFIVLLSALAGPALLVPIQAAADCRCPKSQMVELYGSVSMFPNQLPGPRAHQTAAKKARLPISMTATSGLAEAAPFLKTPNTDRVANPLIWNPLFVQQ